MIPESDLYVSQHWLTTKLWVTFCQWFPSLSSIINPATAHPQRTSAGLLLHIKTWLITTIFSLFHLFLLQAISNAEWESLFVFGECKANAPAATAKWDSKVIHIWQCILLLKTLRAEVKEICIKRLKPNLQSFWITKCFYRMQWLCFIHPSANNLCSKGTLCLWQKLNNLQNFMLSMIFRGENDGQRK